MPSAAKRKTGEVAFLAGAMTTVHVISCYTEECPKAILIEGRKAESQLRPMARRTGWAMVRGAWFCPGCEPIARRMAADLALGVNLE